MRLHKPALLCSSICGVDICALSAIFSAAVFYSRDYTLSGYSLLYRGYMMSSTELLFFVLGGREGEFKGCYF